MTRIESGVTIPKGLFTLYLNVKITTIFRVKKCYFHYDFACKKVPNKYFQWVCVIFVVSEVHKVHSRIKKPPPVALSWPNLKNLGSYFFILCW
jgi:hypothetical protein